MTRTFLPVPHSRFTGQAVTADLRLGEAVRAMAEDGRYADAGYAFGNSPERG